MPAMKAPMTICSKISTTSAQRAPCLRITNPTPRRTQAEDDPDDRGQHDGGESEMGREPVRADVHAAGETTLDHVPAEGALESAEQEHHRERWNEPSRQSPREPEREKRQQERHTGGPGQQSGGTIPTSR